MILSATGTKVYYVELRVSAAPWPVLNGAENTTHRYFR